MRFAEAGERKHRADHWVDQASLDEVRQSIKLASVLAGEHEMIGRVLPPGLDQVLRLGDVDDADQPPCVSERKRASG